MLAQQRMFHLNCVFWFFLVRQRGGQSPGSLLVLTPRVLVLRCATRAPP